MFSRILRIAVVLLLAFSIISCVSPTPPAPGPLPASPSPRTPAPPTALPAAPSPSGAGDPAATVEDPAAARADPRLQPAAQLRRRADSVVMARPGRQRHQPVGLGEFRIRDGSDHHRSALARRLRPAKHEAPAARCAISRLTSTRPSRSAASRTSPVVPWCTTGWGATPTRRRPMWWAACRRMTTASSCRSPSRSPPHALLAPDRGVPIRRSRLGASSHRHPGRRAALQTASWGWLLLPVCSRRCGHRFAGAAVLAGDDAWPGSRRIVGGQVTQVTAPAGRGGARERGWRAGGACWSCRAAAIRRLHFAVKAGVPVRVVFRQLGYVPGGNELLVRWGRDRRPT